VDVGPMMMFSVFFTTYCLKCLKTTFRPHCRDAEHHHAALGIFVCISHQSSGWGVVGSGSSSSSSSSNSSSNSRCTSALDVVTTLYVPNYTFEFQQPSAGNFFRKFRFFEVQKQTLDNLSSGKNSVKHSKISCRT